jgi:hypothetical protein
MFIFTDLTTQARLVRLAVPGTRLAPSLSVPLPADLPALLLHPRPSALDPQPATRNPFALHGLAQAPYPPPSTLDAHLLVHAIIRRLLCSSTQRLPRFSLPRPIHLHASPACLPACLCPLPAAPHKSPLIAVPPSRGPTSANLCPSDKPGGPPAPLQRPSPNSCIVQPRFPRSHFALVAVPPQRLLLQTGHRSHHPCTHTWMTLITHWTLPRCILVLTLHHCSSPSPSPSLHSPRHVGLLQPGP